MSVATLCLRRVAIALITLSLLSCGEFDEREAASTADAVELSDQEDAVCGMFVREQSAPRGQVVHRDGSRFFFCSIGDLLVHLAAPSPHGRAEAVFVEVMSPDEDPGLSHTGAHPWAAAEDAVYVVGIARPGIMGAPVLAYAQRSEAERVIARHPGARALDLDGLREWWRAREAAR